MTELRLIAGDRPDPPVSVVPLQLEARARRPGVAHEEIQLVLDLPATRAIHRVATIEPLPIGLLAVIGIESERALQVAARDADAAALSRRLDWTARRGLPLCRRSTRLAAYAAALRAPQSIEAEVLGPTLDLLVPFHTLLAWEIAATAAGLPLNDWACARLEVAGAGRRLWEAAAAERGQMLAEWVALLSGRDALPD